jgi:predicted RNA-binding protein YlxR (DUF448 family)
MADAGGEAGQDLERTCIVSRKTFAPEALIRFVMSPGGEVVPDIKGKLPGRGAWVEARRSAVEQARQKRLFQRALKQELTVPEDIAGRVETLLRDDALAALALARKSGAAVAGFEKVQAALREGRAIAWLSAEDASSDGTTKLAKAATTGEAGPAALRGFASTELGAVFGRESVTHVALAGTGAGEPAVRAISRWAAYAE